MLLLQNLVFLLLSTCGDCNFGEPVVVLIIHLNGKWLVRKGASLMLLGNQQIVRNRILFQLLALMHELRVLAQSGSIMMTPICFHFIIVKSEWLNYFFKTT